MICVEGTVRHSALGGGSWLFETTDGRTYELQGGPSGLYKDGLRARVRGKVRKDLMTVAMAGDVLEVRDHDSLD